MVGVKRYASELNSLEDFMSLRFSIRRLEILKLEIFDDTVRSLNGSSLNGHRDLARLRTKMAEEAAIVLCRTALDDFKNAFSYLDHSQSSQPIEVINYNRDALFKCSRNIKGSYPAKISWKRLEANSSEYKIVDEKFEFSVHVATFWDALISDHARAINKNPLKRLSYWWNGKNLLEPSRKESSKGQKDQRIFSKQLILYGGLGILSSLSTLFLYTNSFPASGWFQKGAVLLLGFPVGLVIAYAIDPRRIFANLALAAVGFAATRFYSINIFKFNIDANGWPKIFIDGAQPAMSAPLAAFSIGCLIVAGICSYIHVKLNKHFED